jgi:hypothetical protein
MWSRRFLPFFLILAVAGLSLLGSSRVADADREAVSGRFDVRIEVMPWSEYRGPKGRYSSVTRWPGARL